MLLPVLWSRSWSSTCFHVPVRAIGYYCYGHFCYEAGLTGATLGARAQVSMLPASMYSSTTIGLGRHDASYVDTMNVCLRSARSYCVRAPHLGLEQTDDNHRRPCKLCVNWMPEYSDCRSPYSDMHMGPITGLAHVYTHVACSM